MSKIVLLEDFIKPIFNFIHEKNIIFQNNTTCLHELKVTYKSLFHWSKHPYQIISCPFCKLYDDEMANTRYYYFLRIIKNQSYWCLSRAGTINAIISVNTNLLFGLVIFIQITLLVFPNCKPIAGQYTDCIWAVFIRYTFLVFPNIYFDSKSYFLYWSMLLWKMRTKK